MCGRLDYYIDAFSTLRTDKNRKRWSPETRNQEPHKPFLLFSIFDLIYSGLITRNFIGPSDELAETFSGYWQQVMPPGTSASISSPFYQLSTSGFWNLVEKTGRPHRTGRTISSVKKLKEFYVGARFNEDLYPLLVMETSREKLRKAMIQTYFSPQIHHALIEQAIINRSAAN